MRYTFKAEHTCFKTGEILSKVTHETNEICLTDLLDEFKHFLQGTGFCLDGKRIEVVNDD